MTSCPNCQRLLFGGQCLTFGCEATIQQIPEKSVSKSRPKRKGNTKVLQTRDLTKPIPNKVNSSRFASGSGFTSLPTYLGYSRAKDQTDEMRQQKLLEIIAAGPFVPSNLNAPYLRDFGPANSRERVQALIRLFQHLQGGMWYIFEHPQLHKNKLPAAEKLVRDIQWLEEQLGNYS
jgi:hypothetical protein